MADQQTLDAAKTLAENCAHAMYQRDYAAIALEMKILEVDAGFARLSMVIRKDMSNGHGMCHGGMIFSLADTAFAYACNSYNTTTVAAGCNIEYIAPGMLGDTLIAEAREVTVSGRSGIYDVAIRNQDGKAIAFFRGKSRQIKGTVIPDQES
ncbi:acyl-CoA thioesterase [Oceanospirillum multiglobuliferum]|uniref:Phenylacetic acid degradation protein PaaD n=1 Tax=Oceanospirillum multiglobuliferum TaxID=64969 RepID=A0A1T4PF92_9GAMM|nr:hydroxyphenylacetyl-CoA thioesterase PaaI [Oceanospirillum multiglobuliferum]OPX55597.1 phenylacetic acid degradation protein PaaD [Oceanospirillum multiglobuliferum]SJZ89478.1 acyl-CoA thioesterase [Oceanospirillum multiglobuliferum]